MIDVPHPHLKKRSSSPRSSRSQRRYLDKLARKRARGTATAAEVAELRAAEGRNEAAAQASASVRRLVRCIECSTVQRGTQAQLSAAGWQAGVVDGTDRHVFLCAKCYAAAAKRGGA